MYVQDNLIDQLTDNYETQRPGDPERGGGIVGDRLACVPRVW